MEISPSELAVGVAAFVELRWSVRTLTKRVAQLDQVKLDKPRATVRGVVATALWVLLVVGAATTISGCSLFETTRDTTGTTATTGADHQVERTTEHRLGVEAGHQVDVTTTTDRETTTSRELEQRLDTSTRSTTSSTIPEQAAGFLAHGFTGAGGLAELLTAGLTAYAGIKAVRHVRRKKV